MTFIFISKNMLLLMTSFGHTFQTNVRMEWMVSYYTFLVQLVLGCDRGIARAVSIIAQKISEVNNIRFIKLDAKLNSWSPVLWLEKLRGSPFNSIPIVLWEERNRDKREYRNICHQRIGSDISFWIPFVWMKVLVISGTIQNI